MLWAMLALLLCGAGAQLGPEIPDAQISYFGGAARPGTLDGLREAPPATATAILLRGGFGFGTTDMLRAALDSAPHVRLVAFDSPGGRPLVAEDVAKLIQQRRLDTDVERYCASACIIAFVAGTVRSAGPRAVFGFHRASAIALEDLANVMFMRIERAGFVRGGVSLSFGDRALHAPNAQPYLPPLEELLAAGFLHRVRGLAAQGVTVPRDDPVLAEMRLIEPQTSAAIILAERRRRSSGVPAETAQAIGRNEAALVAGRWLSRSSDTAILAWVDARLAALSALDPVSCVKWQVGIEGQDGAYLAIPLVLRRNLQRAEAAILHDANAFPQPLPSDGYDDADAAVRAVVAERYGRHALAVASTPEHALDDPAKSCAVSTEYLRGLRDRPEGASLLRWALAAG